MAKRVAGRHYNDIDPWNYGSIGSNKIIKSLLWTKLERKVYNSGWGDGGRSERSDTGGRRPARKPEVKH